MTSSLQTIQTRELNNVSIPHSKSFDQVLENLNSSLSGLNQAEAKNRLEVYGKNTLPKPKRTNIAIIFFRQFLSPLIYILLIAAAVSIFLHELTDAIFIFAVLFINAIIGTSQEYSAQRSAESLRNIVTTYSHVIRKSETYEINSDELVPGDIVLLESGSKVPADIRLHSSIDLEVDESLLTGESIAVKKDPNTITEKKISPRR